MPTFLALLSPAFDRRFLTEATPEQRALVDRHGEYLLTLAEQGRLLLAGRCWDGPYGVVLLEAESAEEARSLLAGDPSLAAGAQAADVYPFNVFVGPGGS